MAFSKNKRKRFRVLAWFFIHRKMPALFNQRQVVIWDQRLREQGLILCNNSILLSENNQCLRLNFAQMLGQIHCVDGFCRFVCLNHAGSVKCGDPVHFPSFEGWVIHIIKPDFKNIICKWSELDQ